MIERRRALTNQYGLGFPHPQATIRSAIVRRRRRQNGFQIIEPTGPNLEVLGQFQRIFRRRRNRPCWCSLGASLLDEHVDRRSTLVEDVHQ
jgi:hypothetical protein